MILDLLESPCSLLGPNSEFALRGEWPGDERGRASWRANATLISRVGPAKATYDQVVHSFNPHYSCHTTF